MVRACTINAKGLITIPKEIRNHLGVGSGDKIEWVTEGRLTYLRAVKQNAGPIPRKKRGKHLESDLRFLKRVEKARASLRAGRGVRLEDIEND